MLFSSDTSLLDKLQQLMLHMPGYVAQAKERRRKMQKKQKKRKQVQNCGDSCRGVLNIVHGTKDVVNNILDHPDIKAVSFVGSNAAGRYISERASANGKRVQVMLAWQTPLSCIHSQQEVHDTKIYSTHSEV